MEKTLPVLSTEFMVTKQLVRVSLKCPVEFKLALALAFKKEKGKNAKHGEDAHFFAKTLGLLLFCLIYLIHIFLLKKLILTTL